MEPKNIRKSPQKLAPPRRHAGTPDRIGEVSARIRPALRCCAAVNTAASNPHPKPDQFTLASSASNSSLVLVWTSAN